LLTVDVQAQDGLAPVGCFSEVWIFQDLIEELEMPNVPLWCMLTNLPASNKASLLSLQSPVTRFCIKKLNEAVGLFYRNLCEFSVLVENMKQVTFGYSLTGKVAYNNMLVYSLAIKKKIF
jgi:hypothetical protein